MKCKKIHKKIAAYQEGLLSVKESRELEKHLSVCSRCDKLSQRMSAASNSFEKQKITDFDPFFTTRVLAKADALENEKEGTLSFKHKLKPAFRSVLLAAAIFCGVVFGITLSDTGNAKYNREDYIKALGESHYLFEADYTLETMFLTENKEEQ
ncbi:MAG: zf-HC2 domain-containing protein [Bacteroidota bacterium]